MIIIKCKSASAIKKFLFKGGGGGGGIQKKKKKKKKKKKQVRLTKRNWVFGTVMYIDISDVLEVRPPTKNTSASTN